MSEQIRHDETGTIIMVWDSATDEPLRCPTQHDMDTLPVGDDLSADDLSRCDDA